MVFLNYWFEKRIDRIFVFYFKMLECWLLGRSSFKLYLSSLWREDRNPSSCFSCRCKWYHDTTEGPQAGNWPQQGPPIPHLGTSPSFSPLFCTKINVEISLNVFGPKNSAKIFQNSDLLTFEFHRYLRNPISLRNTWKAVSFEKIE